MCPVIANTKIDLKSAGQYKATLKIDVLSNMLIIHTIRKISIRNKVKQLQVTTHSIVNSVHREECHHCFFSFFFLEAFLIAIDVKDC